MTSGVDKRGECECFVNNVNYEYFIEHYSQFEFSSSETAVVAEGGAGRGAVSWLQVDHCLPLPLSSPPPLRVYLDTTDTRAQVTATTRHWI